MKLDPGSRCRQHGQALLEWMVVAILAVMMAIWAAGDWARKVQDSVAHGYAQWLKTVATGLDDALRHSDADDQAMTFWRSELPLNTPTPLEPWLQWLKREGWLPSALSTQLRMPYLMSLLRIHAQSSCQGASCPMVVLLLATPKPGQAIPDAALLLAELGAQGLAVTDLAPDRLRGAVFELNNPMAQGQALPVGTIALLVWRSDRPPPYVRLNESRVVSMSGGVQLGQVSQAGGACQPEGLVMRGPAVQLFLCRGRRWQEIKRDHDHLRACAPLSRNEELVQLLFWSSGMRELFGIGPVCDCPGGFAPVNLGGNAAIGPVPLREGYLCLRL
jgi:hypothetical protein